MSSIPHPRGPGTQLGLTSVHWHLRTWTRDRCCPGPTNPCSTNAEVTRPCPHRVTTNGTDPAAPLYLLRELGQVACRGRCQPLLQEHLLLTGVTPHPERGQVHRQVVLFHLDGKIQREVEDTPAQKVSQGCIR